VLLFDNLSRPGVEQNLRWLQQRHGDLVQIQVADVRDRFALRQALKNTSQVFHFAAQVAVTTSLTNPLHDFEINALGTLNLLEELRSLSSPPPSHLHLHQQSLWQTARHRTPTELYPLSTSRSLKRHQRRPSPRLP
jgi:GDP-D-mannose dehydratase